MIAGWTILALIAVLCIWSMVVYNRLVTLINDIRNAWSQIDIQLKRRYDLIPNLVASVKGYMDHEKQVFDKVVAARSKAISATHIREKAAAEEGLSRELKGLFALIEGYPNLKSNQHVLRLQEELVSTENRISFSRQLYNDLVANFMTKREVFPDMIIASFFRFKKVEYFSASPDERPFPANTSVSRP
jgi:LemA protein